MDEKALWAIADAAVRTQDQPFYILTGSFLSQFSFVEMKLTAILCDMSGVYDLEVFHIITKGMDARVKIDRLRQLARARNRPIGSILRSRLKFFEEHIIPVRNDLAHGSMWTNENDVGKWHVVTIDTFQKTDSSDDGLNSSPKFYTALELAGKAKWCNLFQEELGEFLLPGSDRASLEIGRPMMQAPEVAHVGRDPRGRPAKPRTLHQTPDEE